MTKRKISDITPHNSVLEVYRRFGANLCHRHHGTRLNWWREKIYLKYWYITTRLYGVGNRRHTHRCEQLRSDNQVCRRRLLKPTGLSGDVERDVVEEQVRRTGA